MFILVCPFLFDLILNHISNAILLIYPWVEFYVSRYWSLIYIGGWRIFTPWSRSQHDSIRFQIYNVTHPRLGWQKWASSQVELWVLLFTFSSPNTAFKLTLGGGFFDSIYPKLKLELSGIRLSWICKVPSH